MNLTLTVLCAALACALYRERRRHTQTQQVLDHTEQTARLAWQHANAQRERANTNWAMLCSYSLLAHRQSAEIEQLKGTRPAFLTLKQVLGEA